ncbi:MAG TPA: ABC transporter permease [Sphingobium sp.]|nr:ABC transporter permease [Sphingobium sp.]
MGFRAAFVATLRHILTTRALLSTMILAVLLYGFYYPAPYAHQTSQDLPLVIVDREDSALTRALVEGLQATRAVAVVARVPTVEDGLAMVRQRSADGVLYLPRGLTDGVLQGKGAGGIAIWVNGTYLLRARDIGGAIEQALIGVAAQQAGPLAAALHLQPPIAVVERPLFNTREGYADYIFPAVAIIILQQTLLFGAAMLAGERRAAHAPGLSAGAFLGAWAALTALGVAMASFYFGWIFWAQDVPRGGNIGALILAMPVFAAAVGALGLLVGSGFDHADRALHVLVPTSILLFFLTGAAWPLAAMPGWVEAIAWLSPATAGVTLFVRLNQMGATLGEVWAPLAWLGGAACLYGLAACWRLRVATEPDGPPGVLKADVLPPD